MCGVFGMSNFVKYNLEERFGFQEAFPAEYRIVFRPHDQIPTVSRNSPNKLVLRNWTLVPNWIENPKESKFPTFNARSESIREKPAYRDAWNNAQRCLILMTEFYEYHKLFSDGKKVRSTPYKFSMGGEAFAVAGLYNVWNGIETVTMLTSEPNEQMTPIHSRMPVVLHQEDEDCWLSKDTPLSEAYSLLVPYSENLILSQESPFKKEIEELTLF